MDESLANYLQGKVNRKNKLKEKGVQFLEESGNEVKVSQFLNQNFNLSQLLKKRKYSDIQYLGKGAQSNVVRGTKSDGTRVAIKCFHNEEKAAQKEKEALESCKECPYIVKILDFFKEEDYSFIVLSECKGNLEDLIKSNGSKLNEISAVKYGAEIAEGIHFAHNKGFMIEDIKPDNILISFNDTALICDFGMSLKLGNKSKIFSNKQGNYMFSAPEALEEEIVDEAISKSGFNIKQNVQVRKSKQNQAFSLGVIFAYMMMDKKYESLLNEKCKQNNSNILLKGISPINPILKSLIDGLLLLNVPLRKTVEEAMYILKGKISYEINLDQDYIQEFSGDISSLGHKYNIQFAVQGNGNYIPIVRAGEEETIISQIRLSLSKCSTQQSNSSLSSNSSIKLNFPLITSFFNSSGSGNYQQQTQQQQQQQPQFQQQQYQQQQQQYQQQQQQYQQQQQQYQQQQQQLQLQQQQQQQQEQLLQEQQKKKQQQQKQQELLLLEEQLKKGQKTTQQQKEDAILLAQKIIKDLKLDTICTNFSDLPKFVKDFRIEEILLQHEEQGPFQIARFNTFLQLYLNIPGSISERDLDEYDNDY